MKIAILGESLAYIFGDGADPGAGRADPREPTLLYGSRQLVEEAQSLIESSSPFTHFAMSHEPGDRPSEEQLLEDALVFISALLPRVDLDDLALVVVAHKERLLGDSDEGSRRQVYRRCVHIYLANVHLRTGRRLQPFYHAAHGQRLWQLQSEINAARGYADPAEPERRRRPKEMSAEEAEQFARQLGEATNDAGDESGISPRAWRAALGSLLSPGVVPRITEDEQGQHAKILQNGYEYTITYKDGQSSVTATRLSPRRGSPDNCEPGDGSCADRTGAAQPGNCEAGSAVHHGAGRPASERVAGMHLHPEGREPAEPRIIAPADRAADGAARVPLGRSAAMVFRSDVRGHGTPFGGGIRAGESGIRTGGQRRAEGPSAPAAATSERCDEREYCADSGDRAAGVAGLRGAAVFGRSRRRFCHNLERHAISVQDAAEVWPLTHILERAFSYGPTSRSTTEPPRDPDREARTIRRRVANAGLDTSAADVARTNAGDAAVDRSLGERLKTLVLERLEALAPAHGSAGPTGEIEIDV